MVPWASLQFVIEAVLDHTHVLFLYIYKSIKYSGRLVLREELFLKRDPALKNINQKYDRPLLDLFKFTELSLLLGIHVHLIQNAQLSSGVENFFV